MEKPVTTGANTYTTNERRFLQNAMDETLARDELNRQIATALDDVLIRMQNAKPDERGELARRYAISITELEKAIAYFNIFILQA